MARISKRQAEARWARLHEAFSNFETELVGIIKDRAWEPLGYATFTEAWNDRMSGFKLSNALKPHIVYAMLTEGQSDEEIVRALGGQVSDQSVGRLRQQKVIGVPAGSASTRVRSHDRARPSAPATAHVPLTSEELARFKAVADSRGLNFEQANAGALRDFWRRVESVNARVA